MPLEKANLVTIITERVMESTLKTLVERAGALGYTIEDVAAGWGKHGSRLGQIDSDKTFKMLVVVPESIAQIILGEVERVLKPDYAVLAFRHEVEVLTDAKRSL